MADNSHLLRLPLELRLEVYRYIIPDLITIAPCQPYLQLPRVLASSAKTPIPPWFEHSPLPTPCMAAISASRAPVLPADPCLPLHLTCRAVHNELSQFHHYHSTAHSIELEFCSATCMLAYAIAAPAHVLRRVRQVDVKVPGPVSGNGDGCVAMSALQVHVDGFEWRLREAMTAPRKMVKNRDDEQDVVTASTSETVACAIVLQEKDSHARRGAGICKGRDGLVPVSVLLAAAA